MAAFENMSNELTKSARRVFDILELFRERQCPLRLKDIVDSLEMPTSSAAALLKTMAQLNYLSFESTSRAYLPTLRLSQLGSWVTAANYESGPIQEAVRRIGRKVGETILLGTVTDIYVEIVDILRAKQPLQSPAQILCTNKQRLCGRFLQLNQAHRRFGGQCGEKVLAVCRIKIKVVIKSQHEFRILCAGERHARDRQERNAHEEITKR